jgi:TPR repeat protein
MHRDMARALPLARASLAAGSKYGQFVFGLLCKNGNKGWLPKVAKDVIRAVALMRMAAAQGLDAALLKLAEFYQHGAVASGIAKDDQECLRLSQLSANQGYLPACFKAGDHHERMALDLYKQAAAGGDTNGKYRVKMFSNMYCGPPLDDDYDDDDDDDGVDWTDGDGNDDDDSDSDCDGDDSDDDI